MTRSMPYERREAGNPRRLRSHLQPAIGGRPISWKHVHVLWSEGRQHASAIADYWLILVSADEMSSYYLIWQGHEPRSLLKHHMKISKSQAQVVSAKATDNAFEPTAFGENDGSVSEQEVRGKKIACMTKATIMHLNWLKNGNRKW